MGHFDDCQWVDDDTIAALKARLAKAVASDWGNSTYQSPGEWLPRWLAEQHRKHEEWQPQRRASRPEPEPDEVEGAATENPRASAASASRRSPERSSKPARRARK